jgi:hypothetical protein
VIDLKHRCWRGQAVPERNIIMKKQMIRETAEKRPYNRPQLVKHGNVETLTQGRKQHESSSCPILPN